jgi:hypothetical protein
VLGLIHLNKGNSTDALSQIMGSRAFVAVARAVLYCMVDPDDDDLRLVGQGKSNLGRLDVPTLAFRIGSSRAATTEDGDVWAGRIEWAGSVDRSIREALADAQAAGQPTERGAVGDAAAWLEDYLASGPVASATVKAVAQKAGHTERTLKRAFQRLNGQPSFHGFPRVSFWSLPASLAHARGEKSLSGLTGPTEELSKENDDRQSGHSGAKDASWASRAKSERSWPKLA